MVALLLMGPAGRGYLDPLHGGDTPPDAPPPEAPITFGVIADAQYCNCDPNLDLDRYYRSAPEKLGAAAETISAAHPAFTVHLGDFIEKDFASFDTMIPLYQQIEGPAYYALGNHDFSVDSARIEDVPERLGVERRYYDFSYGSWRFVVLDGNDLSFYATRAGSQKRQEAEAMYQALVDRGAINAKTWNGGMSEQQLAWLEETLQEASQAGEQVVLFSHFPVYPKNEHNLWNANEVVLLLESYNNVAAYMNGHNHAGNYGEKEGIHYVNFKGMVNTPESNAYALVSAYSDHLEINGYGREPNRNLELQASPVPASLQK